MFETLFIAGVIGFLVVFGLVLIWQERRIRRLEEGSWKVGVPQRRVRKAVRSQWHTR